MSAPRPISFLTDFGHADEYIGVVAGVIARIDPAIRVIHVSHGVPFGDIRSGSLMLMRSIQYLPNGVALAVVDPGVGTARRPVAVETEWGHFVGPDNGLLAPAVAMVGGATKAVVIENPEFQLPREGFTFDGRDLFGPAAAVLASGEAKLDDLGAEVDTAGLTPMLLPLVEHGEGRVDGEVWWIDHYGNAQTNVSLGDLELIGARLGEPVSMRVGATDYEVVWQRTYGDGKDPLIHIDSYGLAAIAVPGRSAAEDLNLHTGLSVGFSVTD